MLEIDEENCRLSSNNIAEPITVVAQRSLGNGVESAGKATSIVNSSESARSSCGNNTDPTILNCNIQTEPTTVSVSEIIDAKSRMHNFGWGKFQPKYFQRFCTVKWALFWFCWGGALQGFIVNGFINVVITTLERRFGLRSTQTGLIASGYDISSFLCLLPVSYFGGRKCTSKPKYLACGVIIMGIGSLVFALPHFLVSPYSATLIDEGVCNVNSLTNETSLFDELKGDETATADLTWTVWFFLGGQLLLGAGAAPLYTLGVAYIDENVSKKMSSVYLGIYYAMAVIGPAAGYVIGGQFLHINTDFLSTSSSDIGITSDSNVWVGAWWIGFLIGAILCFLLAIPLFGFPKTLPNTEKVQQVRYDEARSTGEEIEHPKSYTTVKEFPRALWDLMRNIPFVCLNFGAAFEGLIAAGFAAFLPKLIENQYSLSPIYAALLVGCVTVPAGGGGSFLGGYLVKRFNLSCYGIIKMCVITTMIAISLTAGFLLTCPNLPFAGVTTNYLKETSSNPFSLSSLTQNVDVSLEASCNANCSCSGSKYDPICGADNIMYYNPCYAGCQEMLTINKRKTYSNCSCIDHNDENRYPEANNLKCESTCDRLPYFTVLLFLVILCAFAASMPTLSATLRCVHNDQRSFALGIQWLKVRIFGTIPAPIIFGALIDQTCILWSQSSGVESSGSCLLFNNLGMSRYMFALAIVGKSCSLLFYIGAWWFYEPPAPTEQISIQETDKSTEGTIDSKLENK